jgi:hypothetical protein
MGTNNRDRRRQKKRRQAAAERARERRRLGIAAASPLRPCMGAEDIERVLASAVGAQRNHDHDAVCDLEDTLAYGPSADGGDALVDAVVVRYMRRDVAAAGERGWERATLGRYVRRRLGKAHGRVLDLLDDATGDAFIDNVARRLRIGRAYALHHVIEILAFVSSLPPLPKLRSAERRRGGSLVDGRILQRVRALLAKAESTTFPEEAEALTAKAQELMARYSIDRALLEATAGVSTDGVSGRRLLIDDPYAKEKFLLLTGVADVNRCAAVWSKELGWATLFGADDDLDIVELLFTSLLCQASSALMAAGSSAEEPLARRARTKSFRQSFLVAYATRIATRLRRATETAAHEAATTHGSERLLPVLAARKTAADEAAEEAFPHLGRTRFSAHDPAGWAAGAAAADVADLNVRRQVGDTAG